MRSEKKDEPDFRERKKGAVKMMMMMGMEGRVERKKRSKKMNQGDEPEGRIKYRQEKEKGVREIEKELL